MLLLLLCKTEIKFDNKLMRQILIDMSIKDAIVKIKSLSYDEYENEDEIPYIYSIKKIIH